MMKYIILHHPHAGERPYIFHKDETHAEVAKLLVDEAREWRVIRGGFIMWGPHGAMCRGEAFSLRLRADEEKDSKLIQDLLEV